MLFYYLIFPFFTYLVFNRCLHNDNAREFLHIWRNTREFNFFEAKRTFFNDWLSRCRNICCKMWPYMVLCSSNFSSTVCSLIFRLLLMICIIWYYKIPTVSRNNLSQCSFYFNKTFINSICYNVFQNSLTYLIASKLIIWIIIKWKSSYA